MMPFFSRAIRRAGALFLAFALVTSIVTDAGAQTTPSHSAFEGPMTFRLVVPCRGNGPPCWPYVLAEGRITRETPALFLKFVKHLDGRPTLRFHSPGGDLTAAIELGRVIRRLGLATLIGGEYTGEIVTPRSYEVVGSASIARSECDSACVYAFLGGVTRQVVADGALGLHQFRGASMDVGEASAQSTMTILAAYLDEMGVDRRLLDAAGLTPANKLFRLSAREAGELNVDNTRPAVGTWKLDADDDGHLYALVEQEQPGRVGSTVTFVLTTSKFGLLGIIKIDRRDGAFSDRSIDEVFAQAPCPTFRRGDGIEDHVFATRCNGGWRRVSVDSFAIIFSLSPAVAAEMAEAPQVQVNSGFPMVYYSLGPDAVLSTEGMRRALAAIRL